MAERTSGSGGIPGRISRLRMRKCSELDRDPERRDQRAALLFDVLHPVALLDKPALTPPNIVFPIAWSVIYLCIGISAGLILSGDSPRKKRLIALFCVQLLFNFAWSVAFFYFRSPLAGLVDILILDALVAAYVVQSRRASKAASALFVPYVLWLLFATYLNTYILVCN